MLMLHRLFLAILFLIAFSCKLNLNNPNDPATNDFWLRNLIQSALLNNSCSNFSQWNRRYGTGNYSTFGTDFQFLPNGDIVIVGITEDPINSGELQGITGSFAGTPGLTKNFFIMRVARNNGDIQWIDYLGEVYSSLNFKPRLHLYSNGDLAVSFIAMGSGQFIPSNISPKADAGMSVYLGRHRGDGSRVWYTYLDSIDLGIYLVTTVDNLDRFHFFITLDGGNGHTPLLELPSIENSSLGSESDTDILYGNIDQNGIGIFQKYISSSGNDFPFNVSYSNGYVYLAGTTDGSVEGTTHPSLGTQLPYITKFNTISGVREIFVYNGYTSATYGDSRQIAVSNTSILQLLTTNISWSTVVKEPIQSDTQHYAFAQYNLNGGLQWISFLGSSSGDVPNFEEPPTLLDSSGLWRNRSRIPNTFDRYTSGASVTSGTGTGTYQIADVWIRPESGAFDRIRYSSNLGGTVNQRTDQMKELCGGKFGYMDKVFSTESDSPSQLGFQTSQE
ncbi:putative lipoprotein [Leptospira terpstrae serovar Hualin str. LT 11-33 = ATCC 700639]|uniref:Lipoprotein n=2 Tax=Leptospira TaxID=171 RepID=N1W2L2_9LEPT|nr:putative lipoprotein [Leptospira terpstrae serovar Hualin str. LT 11-33 = ATCC 700639]